MGWHWCGWGNGLVFWDKEGVHHCDLWVIAELSVSGKAGVNLFSLTTSLLPHVLTFSTAPAVLAVLVSSLIDHYIQGFGLPLLFASF